MNINKIIVEKKDINFKLPVKVPVEFEFDTYKEMGTAELYLEDGVIKADLKIHDHCNPHPLIPALGYTVDNNSGDRKIQRLGLCFSYNVDETILPIEEQQKNKEVNRE